MIDFITKFLKLKDFMTLMMYDLIVVVVNRLIKYIYFILFKEMYDTEQFGYFYINKIIQY